MTTTGGIKLVKAYLFYDDQSKVPAGNTAKLNQQVNMLLKVAPDGWAEKDGNVQIGAYEKITTNTGQKILEEKDLFATLDSISPADAQFITLKAVITSMTKKFSYFQVSFRVWDKQGTAEIKGSYHLYIKP